MAEVTMLGFASWKDGSFELIVRNPETHDETTLCGTLKPGQLAEVAKILPSCVYVQAEVAPPAPPPSTPFRKG